MSTDSTTPRHPTPNDFARRLLKSSQDEDAKKAETPVDDEGNEKGYEGSEDGDDRFDAG